MSDVPSQEELHELYEVKSKADREYNQAYDKKRKHDREERERLEQERQDKLKADLAQEHGIEDQDISTRIFDLATWAANDRSEGDTDWDDVPDFYRDIAELIKRAVNNARA